MGMPRLIIFTFSLFLALPSTGWAAEKEASEKKTDPAMEKRIELAKKLNDIRPAKDQINEAIDRTAAMIPEENRAAMRDKMLKALDTKVLEKTSIDAMAEIFTEAELQKMIAWYGSPEAVAVAKKIPLYQQRIAPEIFKTLSAVVMPEDVKKDEKAEEKTSDSEEKTMEEKPE
jgi:hypothetical protein